MLRAGGEQVSVRLTGGGPYGLRICALGGNGPQNQLVVAKLHKKSKARAAGIHVGDVVLSINDDRCQRMSQETANHLIDYSYDLTIQLLRGSDGQIHPSVASSFRHSPQPTVSSSPSPTPFHSGSEPATIEPSTATELFRHEVQHHRHEVQDSISVTRTSSLQRAGRQFETRGGQLPAIKETSHGNQESLPQQPTKRVRWSGCGLEPGMTDEESGQEGPKDVKEDGRENGFGWRKRTKPVSAGTESDGEISARSSLRKHVTTSTLAQSQPLPSFQPTQPIPSFQLTSFQPTHPLPSFQPTQPLPSFQPTQPQPSFQPSQALPNKPKPLLWQPPSAVSHTDSTHSAGFESTPLRPSTTTQPLDDLVHEVVIWSSKPTEIEQRDDGARQKPLPWQQSQQPEAKTFAPLSETVTPSLASRQKPSRWQPSPQQTSGNLEGQDHISATKLPAWQPQQPAITVPTERTPSRQPTPTKAVDVLTGERSQPGRQHRWQPSQPPPAPLLNIDRSADQPDHLEEPRRSLQDGSSSPVVTTLFLTRVVTDGSDVIAGRGSDAETTHESAMSDKRKLYGDSSFYEDPEHKYPTIEEQIKMARKVALLLTSPANQNARGQRMFLKRKELSSKWVIDPTLNLTIPRLFVSPPQPHPLYSPPEADHSKILSPGEVERMRYYEEKSHHDVVPFEVCSMMAAELREERGRGGRLFAKRRDKVDQSITHESNGLIRVPSPRPEQRPRFLPEVTAPVIKAERSEVDGAQPILSVPVNRLKGMVELPKPRITPWDSAVEYGTVEPAFEHLKGYRPYTEEPTPVVAGPATVLDHGGRSQGTFRESQGQSQSQGQGQGRDSIQSYGFKRDEVVGERRTANYQSSYSEPKAKITGVAGCDGSSGFLRQASAKGKGHRPVHFDLGSRSFN